MLTCSHHANIRKLSGTHIQWFNSGKRTNHWIVQCTLNGHRITLTTEPVVPYSPSTVSACSCVKLVTYWTMHKQSAPNWTFPLNTFTMNIDYLTTNQAQYLKKMTTLLFNLLDRNFSKSRIRLTWVTCLRCIVIADWHCSDYRINKRIFRACGCCKSKPRLTG